MYWSIILVTEILDHVFPGRSRDYDTDTLDLLLRSALTAGLCTVQGPHVSVMLILGGDSTNQLCLSYSVPADDSELLLIGTES